MADKGRKTLVMSDRPKDRVTISMNAAKDRPTAFMGVEDDSRSSVVISEKSVIGEYTVERVIAENTGEASVFLSVKNGSRYVLKLYHKDKKPKADILSKLREMKSDFVASICDTGESSGRFYTVMPYYENGDVMTAAPVTEEFVEKVLVPSVNEGLKTLHGQGIIHRDIKPSNLYFKEDKRGVVLGDFGISSLLDNDATVRATGMSRTLGYAAPETSAGFVSKESDYYAFGITILQLVTGHDIFTGMTEMQILYQTLNKRIPIPKNISPRIAVLIRGLTQKERKDRWGYNELCRWCRNEYVPLNENFNAPTKNDGSGFIFRNQVYYDLKSLTEAMAWNWEDALVYLFDGALETKLININNGLSREVATLKKQYNRDVALFKCIRILNPDAPIFFCGEKYASLEALSDAIAKEYPKINEKVVKLVSSGCLSYYLEQKGYDSTVRERLKEIADRIAIGKREYYYSLMYFLNPSHRYSENFADLNELADYLEGLPDDERESVCGKLIGDEKFLMWISSKGYRQQLEKWLELSQKEEW